MPGFVRSAACALALAGCHNYGFFPDAQNESLSSTGGTESTSDTDTTTPSPTTVSPTTISPTTVSPTTVSPTTVTATITSDPTEVTTVTTVEPPLCSAIVMPSQVPIQGFGKLEGEDDSVTLSCGPFGTPDVVFEWTPPVSGRFRFETVGSEFDTLLGVFDGGCLGQELACNDDFQDLSSRVEVDLLIGQTVAIVVDTFGEAFATAALTISEVVAEDICPDGDFGSQVGFITPGQTAGATNFRGGSCGGESAPEIEATWTAPFDGVFNFALIESDFEAVLYVRDAFCDGAELFCSGGFLPSVSLFMFAGQTIVIIVDGAGGASGDFTLQISEG